MNLVGHVECVREARNTYVVYVGNSERNKNLDVRGKFVVQWFRRA